MFVKFSPAFDDLDPGAWAPYGETVERLLIAHEARAHLVVLTPKQIAAIAAGIQLSQMTRKVLGVLQRRASDYHQAMAHAGRVLVVCDPSQVMAPTIAGAEVRVPAPWVGAGWMHSHPYLFVEHGVNDAHFYEVLTKSYLAHTSEPPDYFDIKPQHGGGSTLAVVVAASDGPYLKGVCVCDRDTRDPPPPFGGTARGVHDALLARGAIAAGQTGWLPQRPMFAWDIIGAKAIENLVGPYLLDEYFAREHSARAYRASVVAAYSSFPNLNDDEMRVWLLSNSKEGEQDEIPVAAAFERQTGRAPPWPTPKLRRMSQVHVPTGVVEWVGKMGRASAIERTIRAAIRRDLTHPVYRSAVEPVPYLIRDLLAADPTLQHS